MVNIIFIIGKLPIEQISGENYTKTTITMTEGSTLRGGEVNAETVQYLGPAGYFLDGVFEINNTSLASNLYNYMASSLLFAVQPSPFNLATPGDPVSNSGSLLPTQDANATANMIYRGFNRTYLLKPEFVNCVDTPY